LLSEADDPTGARFGLAAPLYRLGNPSEARGELESLVRSAPSHAEAWNLLGAVRAEAGELESAAAAFDRAIAADPWYVEAVANAFRLAERRGDARAAERHRQRLHALEDR
jgi:predicted Zn-dependent protease